MRKYFNHGRESVKSNTRVKNLLSVITLRQTHNSWQLPSDNKNQISKDISPWAITHWIPIYVMVDSFLSIFKYFTMKIYKQLPGWIPRWSTQCCQKICLIRASCRRCGWPGNREGHFSAMPSVVNKRKKQ
jgi:hypothetical protein